MIREMQTKALWRHSCAPIRMEKINITAIGNAGEDLEQMELS